ncbi:MAG TPA: hypothetical protein VJ201_02820 [Candidatus Babeliales bacterium]|nr:hypothetical protein [Candidatus Babeliales bacterium]
MEKIANQITIFLLIAYILYCPPILGTIIKRYELAQHPERENKILILSASPASKTVAHIHQLIFRTYLNMLMVDKEQIDLITEDIVPSATQEKQAEEYKQYLEYYQTRTIKYIPHDYRTKRDADILAIFHLLAKELDTLFETGILSSKDPWPTKEFFQTNGAYQIIKEEIINKAPKLSVDEYQQHITEQALIFKNKEIFSLIPTDILTDIEKEFTKQSNNAIQWLSQNKTSDTQELISILLSAIESGSEETIHTSAMLCTAPGFMTAQAGFLQEILASQDQQHDTIFFAFISQTQKISDYLKKMGYETILATDLVKKNNAGKFSIISPWTMINLFMQSFATTKEIETQANFFNNLVDL